MAMAKMAKSESSNILIDFFLDWVTGDWVID
jgi:hypothetical protein